MSYQGARARTAANESTRVFEVSRLRLDERGRISDVLWVEVNARTGHEVGPAARTPVADVIDAIHDGVHVAAVFSSPHAQPPERYFVVVEHDDGQEGLVLDDLPSRGRELANMARLDD